MAGSLRPRRDFRSTAGDSDVQIEATAVFGAAGSLLAFGVTIYIAIFRYALSQKEREIDRRFEDVVRRAESTTDRLNDEEKATIRQDGQINLVQNNHDALTRDLEEIKRNMITKAEFEPRMTNLERTLNQILAELRGRYPSYGQMPAVTGTPSPPKR